MEGNPTETGIEADYTVVHDRGLASLGFKGDKHELDDGMENCASKRTCDYVKVHLQGFILALINHVVVKDPALD